jgi:hypothetical protein
MVMFELPGSRCCCYGYAASAAAAAPGTLATGKSFVFYPKYITKPLFIINSPFSPLI